MKSIINIILLILYFKVVCSQNLIKDGQDFDFQTNKCNTLKNWEIFETVGSFCEASVQPNCVKIFRFSTSLNNEYCYDNGCGGYSDFTPLGVNGIPSSRSWAVQNTDNSLAGLDETYIGLPLVNLLFDTRRCARSGIYQKIRKLKAGLYRLKLDVVFKTPINDPDDSPILTVELDDNYSLNNPEFSENIIVSIDGGNDNNEWQHVNLTINIEENCEIDYIRIFRQFGEKGGLLLVDNISLESICAEENRCSLNKFNDDNNITSNNIHNALTPLTFTGLAGLPLATLLIYKGNNIVASKTFVQPLNTIYWDGKNNDGNELDNDEYSYKLMAFTRCDCGITLENDFHKTGNMNIPFPVLNNAVQSESQAIIISNLNNVHEMKFKIESTNSAVVYNSPTYFNPPNQFYWNGNISGSGFLASGNYLIKIFAKNNCGEKENSFPIQVISPIDYNNFSPNTFLNSSITKDDFMCSKTNYFPAYFAPLPCCSSAVNLSYSNGFIEGNQDFISYGNITLGENLTILPGSTIDFIANDNVILNPGVIIDGTSSYVVLENQNCTAQRIGIVEDSNDSIANSKDERNKTPLENNLVKSITIFPNPANNNFTINASEQIISYLVYDVSGKQITRQENVAEKNIQVSSENLHSGIYFVNVITPKSNQTTKLMISKE